MSSLVLPDTPLVKEGMGILKATASPAIVNHSLRTFLLARAYARREKRRLDFDEEGLLLAAFFHDLGLFEPFRDKRRAFTVSSSRQLRAFLEEHDVPPERIGVLCEAIELHFLVWPRWSKGNTVGLLQVGAWMDITGLRRWSVRPAARDIRLAFPREGLGRNFTSLLFKSFGSFSSCFGLLAAPRA